MRLNIENLGDIVCKYADISKEQLFSKCRKRNIVSARHCFFYLANKNLGYGSAYLGKYVGNDHATVLHGIQCAKDHIFTQWEPFTMLLDACLQEIVTNYQNDVKLTVSVPFGVNLEEITDYLKAKACRIVKFT